MPKCGNKFCSKPGVKDAKECGEKVFNTPHWRGVCFWQKEGAGCEECGEKMIRASSCSYCVECGWSKCL